MLRFNTWALHAVQYGVSVEGFEKMRKGENFARVTGFEEKFRKSVTIIFSQTFRTVYNEQELTTEHVFIEYNW